MWPLLVYVPYIDGVKEKIKNVTIALITVGALVIAFNELRKAIGMYIIQCKVKGMKWSYLTSPNDYYR